MYNGIWELHNYTVGIAEEQSAPSQEILATTESMNETAKEVFQNSKSVARDAGALKDNANLPDTHMSQFTL